MAVETKRWQYKAYVDAIGAPGSFAETPQIDKFAPQKPDILFRPKEVRYLYPSFTIDPKLLTQSENIYPDKWIGQYPDKVFDLKRQQYTYPTLSFQINSFPEVVYPDKYIPPTERPRWDAKRWQYLYPTFSAEPFNLTTHEVVYPDKYVPPTEKPRWDVRRNQYLYPSFATDSAALTQRETIYPDKWFVETARPKWDLKRWQYLFPSTSVPEAMQPPQQVAVFSNSDGGVIFTKLTQYQSVARPTFVPPETVTLDKWFVEAARPRWDIKRQQYTYPYTSIPDAMQPPQQVMVFGSTTSEIVFTRLTQYQTMTFVPRVPGASTVVKKLQRHMPRRIHRMRMGF